MRWLRVSFLYLRWTWFVKPFDLCLCYPRPDSVSVPRTALDFSCRSLVSSPQSLGYVERRGENGLGRIGVYYRRLSSLTEELTESDIGDKRLSSVWALNIKQDTGDVWVAHGQWAGLSQDKNSVASVRRHPQIRHRGRWSFSDAQKPSKHFKFRLSLNGL